MVYPPKIKKCYADNQSRSPEGQEKNRWNVQRKSTIYQGLDSVVIAFLLHQLEGDSVQLICLFLTYFVCLQASLQNSLRIAYGEWK